ncbi:hypothetical protein, partial [Vibrio cholerae]|uniref:hypothetical protein n=1 Tax=Vibrio cholerae TaxID=666 RepID=UPI001F431C06
ILSQQEAIFVGVGSDLPSRVRVRDLKEGQLPKSNTIPFAQGWASDRLEIEKLKEISERMCS